MGQSGFSLVSVMVSVAILGTMSTLLATAVSNNVKLLAKVDERGELADLRNTLRGNIDCTVPSCHALLDSIPTRIGKWQIGGNCSMRGLFIEAHRVGENGSPALDPLTRAPSAPRPLFPGNGGYICTRFSAASQHAFIKGSSTRGRYSGWTTTVDFTRDPQQALVGQHEAQRKVLELQVKDLMEKREKAYDEFSERRRQCSRGSLCELRTKLDFLLSPYSDVRFEHDLQVLRMAIDFASELRDCYSRSDDCESLKQSHARRFEQFSARQRMALSHLEGETKHAEEQYVRALEAKDEPRSRR